ncbi:MAG: MBL fold metallo-hydrolase [Bacteroidales bacterium]|nr:MBL fold metallo-hydrolase [Bacteroidales bacterium]
MEAKRYNTFYTPVGLLNVAHLGHGSVHIEWEGMHIYVDPYNDAYDFTGMKKADLILLTHAHTDHYDCEAIKKIATPNTKFVVSKGVGTCLDNDLLRMRIDVDNNPLNVDPSTNLENMKKSIAFLQLCSVAVMHNGDKVKARGVEIEATPAYNVEQKRDNGHPFHIKGEGNGYILNFGGFKVYFAGDTEFVPEMAAGKGADIAFLPKNLPYTLSDEKFIEAANMLNPKNLFPIHYFEMDWKKLARGLRPGISLYVDGVHCTDIQQK